MSRIYLILFFICILYNNQTIQAQEYHAIHGSPYAGAASIFNNPAAGINSIYKWDLNLFSFQTTVAANHLTLLNTSFTNPSNAVLSFDEGSNSHYAHQNLDLNLFSFQYKIDENKAFSIGFRGRMYNHAKTSPIIGNDTITSNLSFLKANRTTPFIDGYFTHAGWLETNLNYSQVLYESKTQRLTGGISLNLLKGISGAYGKLNKISVAEFVNNGVDTGYTLVRGGLNYAYSSNYDNPTANISSTQLVKNFLKNSLSRIGISMGMEYSIYNDDINDRLSNNPINYSWKIGLSIMDIGHNTFKPSEYAGNFYTPQTNITDAIVGDKFSNIPAIDAFRDSLKTMFQNYEALTSNFTISTPTRIILNVDKNLGNHFAVNTELNMNLFSTANYAKLLTRELNLLTVTPRWETIFLGCYMPIQYNTQGNLWIGAALKFGPLTIGLHDISWTKKISSINGGGYILFSLHPFNTKKVINRFDCPE